MSAPSRFLLITEPARCSSVLVTIRKGETADEALSRYCFDEPSLRPVAQQWYDSSEMTSLAAWLQDATGDSVQFVNVTRIVE
jgi:hypothetical protein